MLSPNVKKQFPRFGLPRVLKDDASQDGSFEQCVAQSRAFLAVKGLPKESSEIYLDPQVIKNVRWSIVTLSEGAPLRQHSLGLPVFRHSELPPIGAWSAKARAAPSSRRDDLATMVKQETNSGCRGKTRTAGSAQKASINSTATRPSGRLQPFFSPSRCSPTPILRYDVK